MVSPAECWTPLPSSGVTERSQQLELAGLDPLRGVPVAPLVDALDG